MILSYSLESLSFPFNLEPSLIVKIFYHQDLNERNVLRGYTYKIIIMDILENSLNMILYLIQSKHIKKISLLKFLSQLHVSSSRARWPRSKSRVSPRQCHCLYGQNMWQESSNTTSTMYMASLSFLVHLIGWKWWHSALMVILTCPLSIYNHPLI